MSSAYRPLCLQDALCFLAREGAQVLAGGTDWMVKRRRAGASGRPVLYIGGLPELRQVSLQGADLRIGAACTLSELLEHPLLPGYVKLPIAQMASPAIRNIATIGGNLCNASPAADVLPMLCALDALLCLRSDTGGETLPARDFIRRPGEPRLKEGQLLCDILIPLGPAWRCTYRKIGLRRANSLSKVSFYALACHGEGQLRDIRIALGAVAPNVIRSPEAERAILALGPRPSPERLDAVAAMYDRLVQPIDDARSSRTYRREAAARLLTGYLREGMNA